MERLETERQDATQVQRLKLDPKSRYILSGNECSLRSCVRDQAWNSTCRGRTTWFPAPRSPSSLTCGPHPSAAPTGCRSLGTQERTQWAFPAATATPERTTGKPSPTPARSRPPPRAAPPLPCSRCLPSRSGDPRSTTGTAPHPRHDPVPDPRRPASPRPGRAPGALPTFTTGSRWAPPPRPVPGEPLGPRYRRPVKREDNTSSPQRQSKLSRIQGSNEDYGKERWPDLG